MKRLLLISTSTTHGTGYLDHCAEELRDVLGGSRRVLFLPYALFDRDGYADKAVRRFRDLGYEMNSIHLAPDPVAAVEGADAVFVGGGNTFRLLGEVYARGLLDVIRERVLGGMVYTGASAGSNLACPTVRTTNDMPITEPPSLTALGLVPFQINPHYLDPEPGSTHMGETRETRIREYLEENDRVVVGLREGAMIRVDGHRATLRGDRGARIFRRGREPEERAPGASLGDLLAQPASGS